MGPSIPALVASGADTRLGRRCRYGKRVDRKRMSGRGNHFCFAGNCAQWKNGTLAQTLISPLTKQALGRWRSGGFSFSNPPRLVLGEAAWPPCHTQQQRDWTRP